MNYLLIQPIFFSVTGVLQGRTSMYLLELLTQSKLSNRFKFSFCLCCSNSMRQLQCEWKDIPVFKEKNHYDFQQHPQFGCVLSVHIYKAQVSVGKFSPVNWSQMENKRLKTPATFFLHSTWKTSLATINCKADKAVFVVHHLNWHLSVVIFKIHIWHSSIMLQKSFSPVMPRNGLCKLVYDCF